MHPVVKQLLALQEVDNRVAQVEKKIHALPKETARREREYRALEEFRNRVVGVIEEAEAENEALEKKVLGLEAAIKRQEEHRDKAQNASIFEAAQHQIQYLKQDKEQLQNQQLACMEKIEELTPQRKDLESRLKAATEELELYREEAGKLQEDLERERKAIAVERKAHLAGISEQHLRLYRDLFHSRNGQAVVMLEGEVCSGCYTRITVNDQARLQAGSAVVTCNSCRRILYLP